MLHVTPTSMTINNNMIKEQILFSFYIFTLLHSTVTHAYIKIKIVLKKIIALLFS